MSRPLPKMDDYVSRVLGGGINNRWTTRLKPTKDWLTGRRKARKFREFKKRLLGMSRLTYPDIAEEAKDAEILAFFKYAMHRVPPKRSKDTSLSGEQMEPCFRSRFIGDNAEGSIMEHLKILARNSNVSASAVLCFFTQHPPRFLFINLALHVVTPGEPRALILQT